MPTPSDLSVCKAVIVVFAMPGCPACDDYMPRLMRQVEGFQRYRVPFVVHAARQPVRAGTCPILLFDARSRDEAIQEYADQQAIEALPTTLFLTRHYPPVRYEGAMSDQEIYEMLCAAAQAVR